MLGQNNTKKRPQPPSQPSTAIAITNNKLRRKNNRAVVAAAAEWNDLPNPILIGIFNWLDQESLMSLSLVSKKNHKIIANAGPGGIENKIIPVFEVSGSSTRRLFQIVRDNFLNEETKNKLQYYPRMRLNNVHEFVFDRISDHEIQQMTRDVRMDWITSLDMSNNSPVKTRHCLFSSPTYKILHNLSNMLPKLRELDFSKSGVEIYSEISRNCPLLEKITADNLVDMCFPLNGDDMAFCNNLKEIYMDHSSFNYIGSRHKDQISDLDNHNEIFMFHRCCKALERVSIRNMNFKDSYDDDGDPGEDFTQNSLIKFVRNAPPTLYWFRSDLTLDNITMLRMERPGIEFLN